MDKTFPRSCYASSKDREEAIFDYIESLEEQMVTLKEEVDLLEKRNLDLYVELQEIKNPTLGDNK